MRRTGVRCPAGTVSHHGLTAGADTLAALSTEFAGSEGSNSIEHLDCAQASRARRISLSEDTAGDFYLCATRGGCECMHVARFFALAFLFEHTRQPIGDGTGLA